MQKERETATAIEETQVNKETQVKEMADAFNERAALYESYTARVVESAGQWQVEIASEYGAFSSEVIKVMLEVASWYGARMYISATGDEVYAYIYWIA